METPKDSKTGQAQPLTSAQIADAGKQLADLLTSAEFGASVFGLCLAGAMATRYEALLLIPVAAVAAAIATDKLSRWHAAVIATLPALFVFGCWTLASSLIMNDALFWWHQSKLVISR